MYEKTIRAEFTHQSDSFRRSPAMSSAETLGALVELAPRDAEASWLEIASGPGIVSRALAPRVGRVLGVDLTPAMIDAAREAASEAGAENVGFTEGDATALDLEGDSFDGAIARFTLHHVPAPARVVAEMARVVRPGGWVVLGDHLADEDADGAAWHEEIERLRDPSHWACVSLDRMRRAGEAAGLALDSEQVIPLRLDFDEWLGRGSGGDASAPLIDRLLEERPQGAGSFRVVAEDAGGRTLELRYWISRWRVG